MEGNKVRERSPSFGEYYSHPRLFWLSQTPFEQRHIVDGFSFELAKSFVRIFVSALLTSWRILISLWPRRWRKISVSN
ncbi:catalase-related domain-containing protein [Escherichia coli]